jgi:hypothetical protein
MQVADVVTGTSVETGHITQAIGAIAEADVEMGLLSLLMLLLILLGLYTM